MVMQLRNRTNSVQLVAIADPLKTNFRDVVEGYLSLLVRLPGLTQRSILHTRL